MILTDHQSVGSTEAFWIFVFFGIKSHQAKKTVAPVEVPLNRIKSTIDAMVKCHLPWSLEVEVNCQDPMVLKDGP